MWNPYLVIAAPVDDFQLLDQGINNMNVAAWAGPVLGGCPSCNSTVG